jgi:3-oxoacyl-(acyl-carrier-protein) synthase
VPERADVVPAGGSDLLCRFVVAGFNRCARPPRWRGRSIATAADWWGEGAAMLVIEEEDAARRRCARHCARARHRAAGDAVHMTAPDREGARRGARSGPRWLGCRLVPAAVDSLSPRMARGRRSTTRWRRARSCSCS